MYHDLINFTMFFLSVYNDSINLNRIYSNNNNYFTIDLKCGSYHLSVKK